MVFNPNLEVIGWKIYYGIPDRTEWKIEVFTSKDGKWEDAPNENVGIILLYFKGMVNEKENYRRIMSGEDYYWRQEIAGEVVYGMGTPYDASIPFNAPEGIVKTGRWMPDRFFQKLHNIAYADKLWVE
jgi:hypothetical protein